jgi:hypothetical protein
MRWCDDADLTPTQGNRQTFDPKNLKLVKWKK